MTLSPRYPGAISFLRQGWKTPKRTPGSAYSSVYSSGVLFGDLRVSRSVECDLPVLSIYPRIFLRVFIVWRLLLGYFLRCILP